MKKVKIGRLFGYDIFIELPDHLTHEDIDKIVEYVTKKLK